MEKVIRGGQVAVLYSRGFGAGWYSWNTSQPWMMFHPRLVEAVELKASETEISEIANAIARELGDETPYTGGADGLTIQWIEQGTQFKVVEYDGAESIEILGQSTYEVA
jgi:hypothetical protein